MDHRLIGERPVLHPSGAVWCFNVLNAETDANAKHGPYAAKDDVMDACNILSILPVVPIRSCTLLVNFERYFNCSNAIHLSLYR